VQSTMLRVFGTAFSFCHAQEQICPQIHGSVLRGTVLREGSRRFFSCGGGRARGGPRSHNVVLRSQGLFVPFGERRSRAWCAVALHCGRGLDEELNGAVSVWVVAVLCARPEGPGHGGDVKGGVFVGIWIRLQTPKPTASGGSISFAQQEPTTRVRLVGRVGRHIHAFTRISWFFFSHFRCAVNSFSAPFIGSQNWTKWSKRNGELQFCIYIYPLPLHEHRLDPV